jgi:hypothetical protein
MRAGWWALLAIRRARRQLDKGGIEAVRLRPPPSLPPEAEIGVRAAFRLWSQPCLIYAAVRQEWLAARGCYRDIVIGVTAPNDNFRAHAWLDGDPPCHSEGFEELVRRPLP